MKPREEETDGAAVRKRILGAALSAFMEGGYAQTSTLEIATRARVSKRELYSLFGNKEAMLVACITERARRFEDHVALMRRVEAWTIGVMRSGS
jgi:AcrR family transcriptional regulator